MVDSFKWYSNSVTYIVPMMAVHINVYNLIIYLYSEAGIV